MRLKHLEEALQPVKGFQNPVVELEQYITSPHLASHMIHAAYQAEGMFIKRLLTEYTSLVFDMLHT